MDFSTVLGYYGLIFLFCQICLAIQAANYGFALVSIEEREMTADFLLAKPVGRTKILTSKLLSAITGLTITNIVIWISSFVFIKIFAGGREYDAKPLVLLLLTHRGVSAVFPLCRSGRLTAGEKDQKCDAVLYGAGIRDVLSECIWQYDW